MKEYIVRLGQSNEWRGVLTEPDGDAVNHRGEIVVFLNAGIINRTGPGRIHVKWARNLAGMGYRCFRFDTRKSAGGWAFKSGPDSWERARAKDVSLFLDAFANRFQSKRFILAGICSGADDAFWTARLDQRISGVILVNGTFLMQSELKAMPHKLGTRARMRLYDKRITGRIGRLSSGFNLFQTVYDTVCAAIQMFLSIPKRGNRDWTSIVTRLKNDLGEIAGRSSGLTLLYSEGSTAWDFYQLEVGRRRLGEFPLSTRMNMLERMDHAITPSWGHDWIIKCSRVALAGGSLEKASGLAEDKYIR